MDEQKTSLQAETSSHEAIGEETWSDGDASLNIIELRPVTFSAKTIQHGRHPTNAGRMGHPDAHASRVGWCGEVMEMYVRPAEDRITEASFWADGCLSTMACGDMLMTMARGMAPEAAAAITAEDLIAALDGLPYKSHHCAELSVETLREAIAGPLNERR
jgi:nitrogen fixation protein NifU and related proteins